jgi:signal transduction histidine kinase
VEDEIGALTQHFNQMAYTIHRAEQQLKDYAETLEQKVEARTAELARSLAELKAAQAQLIQAEKMASLGSLTAGIAHEIKNPLNFVNNFALLSTELTADLAQVIDAHKQRLPGEVIDDLQEMLDDLTLNAEKIHHHGLRADGIVQSMLAHSRSGESERRTVDLNALLDEYVNLAYHGMRAAIPSFNATIERDYAEALGAVHLVPQDMGRVLLNLINNAFYAVHQQAGASNGAYIPTVQVRTRRHSDHIEIRVADNGPGIAESLCQKIFEPFYTTKPTGTGTGLGLSISYDIVVQGHGGMLTVESTEGEGAAFIVTLPNV